MRQKMEFIYEDISSWAEPSDEDLSAFLKKNREKYIPDPLLSFRQVFINANMRGRNADSDARQALARLNAGEWIYDVAVSGDRKIDKDGRCKTPVGSTGDVANATWTNTIGAPELIAVWKDPDFDPALKAFYYARVIEIPTPRWTAYDAKRFGVKPLEGTTMTIQERAYTSPIWYTP
jgi:hypothetical protein